MVIIIYKGFFDGQDYEFILNFNNVNNFFSVNIWMQFWFVIYKQSEVKEVVQVYVLGVD